MYRTRWWPLIAATAGFALCGPMGLAEGAVLAPHHWLEGADHSFHVLKSSGRTDEDVMAEVGNTARDWRAQLDA